MKPIDLYLPAVSSEAFLGFRRGKPYLLGLQGKTSVFCGEDGASYLLDDFDNETVYMVTPPEAE